MRRFIMPLLLLGAQLRALAPAGGDGADVWRAASDGKQRLGSNADGRTPERVA